MSRLKTSIWLLSMKLRGVLVVFLTLVGSYNMTDFDHYVLVRYVLKYIFILQFRISSVINNMNEKSTAFLLRFLILQENIKNIKTKMTKLPTLLPILK